MKLYYAPAACSLSVHIALLEANLPFQLEKVDLAAHQLENGDDYYAISPRGYVPALELDDGSLHTEAAALLQYVGSRSRGERLLPEFGSIEWLQTVEWLTFVSSELHKGFGPLWNPGTPETVRQAAKDRLFKRFEEVERGLNGSEYLAGRFSVADAYCFTVVRWSGKHGMDLSPYPDLSAYLERVAQRPKVRQALEEEGLA